MTVAAILASRPRAATAALLVRLAAGGTFVAFALGKFLRHDAEARAFDRYGVPFPDLATYAIGCVELGGGLLLLLGLLTRPAALALAGTMIGAISTGGRVEGGPIHLGLAPTLLVAMVFLLWAGAGRHGLDAALARRLDFKHP